MKTEEFTKKLNEAAEIIYNAAKVHRPYPPYLLINLGWNRGFGGSIYVTEDFINWLIKIGWVIKDENILPNGTKQYLMTRGNYERTND